MKITNTNYISCFNFFLFLEKNTRFIYIKQFHENKLYKYFWIKYVHNTCL